MDDWFTMCDHCRVQFSSSPHMTLLPSPTDSQMKVRCGVCKLTCSYQLVNDDSPSSFCQTPIPTSRFQHYDPGSSQLSHASGHSEGDQSSRIQGISNALSGLSLSSRQYAVSEMSIGYTYDAEDVTSLTYDAEDVPVPKFGEYARKGYDHRTLRKMNLSSTQIANLKKKYVIAESVSPEVALKRVEGALATWSQEAQRYRLRMPGKSKDDKLLYKYEGNLGQIARLRRPTYLVRRQKSLRLGKLLTIIKGLLEKHEYLRVRLLSYMYPDICRSTTPELSMQLLRDSIAELTVLLEVTRESLMLTTTPRGVTLGPAILCARGKDLIDCNLGGATGNLIPCEVETVDEIKPTGPIEFVLLVEKDTIYQYLASQGFDKKHNCLLLTGRGEPDIYTRVLLRKYYDLLSVPLYALTDGNPFGCQIFCTFCFGSQEKAHENLFLTVPQLDYIGLFVADIAEGNRTTLSDDDEKILSSLLTKEYIDNVAVERLRDNLVFMDETKTKADIEMMIRQQRLDSYILKNIQEAKDRKMVLAGATLFDDGH